jgi:transcriptional regulator with XRE-family HTH domain
MTTWLDRRIARQAGQVGFETERLLLDMTEAFTEKMIERKWTRAELARKMGVDRSVVTRALAGDRNVSLRTLVSFATTLGCRLKIELTDRSTSEASSPTADFFTKKVVADLRSSESDWEVFSVSNASAMLKQGRYSVQQIGAADGPALPSSSKPGDPRVIRTAA